MRLVVKHYPYKYRDFSLGAAEASLAAPAVVVNDVPTWAAVRGRDGITALVEAMTEPQSLVLD